MSENKFEILSDILAGQTNVLIHPHNYPDPDAISSSAALRYFLKERYQVESQIIYAGYIGRVENKALVQYLNKPLRLVRSSDWNLGHRIALVDTQPGVGNNALPEGRRADIVIDHHPGNTNIETVAYVDIRTELGASSTILTHYLIESEIEPTTKLATALFFGIKTDTMGLSRSASPSDIDAYFYLQQLIDVDALVRIEQAQVPASYFQSIDNAIHAGQIFDKDIVAAYIGYLTYPDLCAEIADLFMRLSGIQWVLCMGVFRNEFIMSVRSRDHKVGAGKLVKEIIGNRGQAGGHGMMAAGNIHLEPGDDPEHIANEMKNNLLITLKGTQDLVVNQIIGEKI